MPRYLGNPSVSSVCYKAMMKMGKWDDFGHMKLLDLANHNQQSEKSNNLLDKLISA
jgi:hypothetical protein